MSAKPTAKRGDAGAGARLGATVAASVAVHAAVGGYLVSRPAPPPRPPPAQDALAIEVLPAAASPASPGGRIAPSEPDAPALIARALPAPLASPERVPARPEDDGFAAPMVGLAGLATTAAALEQREPERRAPNLDAPEPARAPPEWMRSDADRARRFVPEMPAPPPPPPRSPLAPPEPRSPPRVRSELRPNGGGTFKADDTTFNARIGRDGRVEIEDKRNLQARLRLPGRRGIGRALERWAEDPYGTTTGGQHPDSNPSPTPPPSREDDVHIVPFVSGSFDLTDWAMRRSGQDPYQRRKAEFLDRTRSERAGIAANARSDDLREATRKLSVRLVEIWRHEAWSAERRRQTLFELWDECAESGPREVVDAAREVRETIERFIRTHLPADSADAYSADELRRLNAERSSTQEFAPYRGAG